MPTIQIIGPVNQSLDESVPRVGSVEIIDGYLDEAGALHRRPGLLPWTNLGTGEQVDGMFFWMRMGWFVMVSAGRVFASDARRTTIIEITNQDRNQSLIKGRAVTFAPDKKFLYMANGGPVVRWNGDPLSPVVKDDGAPSKCSFVAQFRDYIVAVNDGTNEVSYAIRGVNDPYSAPPTWSPITFSMRSSSAPILSMARGWEELFLLTEDSGEFRYIPAEGGSETDPIPVLEASHVNTGIYAPNSLAAFDNTWVFINYNRDVVRLDGRVPKIISQSVDMILKNMRELTDAVGMVVDNFYILTFPSQNQTLVYDAKVGMWYKWLRWRVDTGSYERWIGSCAHRVIPWNANMVGGRDGIVYVMHHKLQTDGGSPIRTKLLTCHFDHGTLNMKRNRKLSIRVRRGY